MATFATVRLILRCVPPILIATATTASSLNDQRQVATTIADETFIVSGTLVREDQTPIAGISIMIAEPRDDGYAVSIGEAGVVQNPHQRTDAAGRFSIAVTRSLFTEREEFVLVVPFFGPASRPIRHLGSAVAMRIDDTKKEYDLGPIGATNPLIR
jgi:hypothetical protein